MEDEDLFTKVLIGRNEFHDLSLSQTFFDLRDQLTEAKVDVQSFKLHHSELETDKDDVFEFVSQSQDNHTVPFIFFFAE